MLRIGKNPNENEQPDKQESTAYNTPRSYAPAPSVDMQPKSAVEAGSSRALTESESLARDIKEGTLSGFVGSGTVVTGEASFKAMMRIDGQLSGRITSSAGTLVVGTNGRVDANIEVAVATVHGTVNGDIVATQRLELGRSAKVSGNIQTPSLMIEQGAIFEGSCKMTQANAAAEKSKKGYASDEPVLDTSRMKPVSGDRAGKGSDITNVSDVAS
ncbi:MAG TPA: polymer-forming cytoskeletal protein [Pyrinomonadaceae bacterium]|jgi:cytoskeletal protein CcmA (bactofilin family)|nr:polymer-forming cytoskeletal protein [Pyrinomonadaceae bacterium]